jgi:hypothetical protein
MNDRPLFVPLRREWFNAFARGEKTVEWRREGPKWNRGTCRVGRRVVLSLGYQGRRRLFGTVISVELQAASGAAAKLFGDGTLCILIGVALDPQ